MVPSLLTIVLVANIMLLGPLITSLVSAAVSRAGISCEGGVDTPC